MSGKSCWQIDVVRRRSGVCSAPPCVSSQGFCGFPFAALLTAIVIAACASEDEEVFEIGDGRPDASLDTGIARATGGGPSFDSCQPDFCPAIGPGAPCCITPEGPCGMDTGLGCRSDVSRQVNDDALSSEDRAAMKTTKPKPSLQRSTAWLLALLGGRVDSHPLARTIPTSTSSTPSSLASPAPRFRARARAPVAALPTCMGDGSGYGACERCTGPDSCTTFPNCNGCVECSDRCICQTVRSQSGGVRGALRRRGLRAGGARDRRGQARRLADSVARSAPPAAVPAWAADGAAAAAGDAAAAGEWRRGAWRRRGTRRLEPNPDLTKWRGRHSWRCDRYRWACV